MSYYRIAEWDQYQHYKDRSPPWIKLHRNLLTSRTWVALDDASRVLAVACMCVAADTENKIPDDPVFLMRRAYLSAAPDFAPLVAVGFLELINENKAAKRPRKRDASKPVQTVQNAMTEERERQSRAEEDPSLRSGSPRAKLADLDPADFRELADAEHRDPVRELADFRDWCAKNGRTFKDYRAAFRNWLRSPYGREPPGEVNGAKATEARLMRHFEQMERHDGPEETRGGEVLSLTHAAGLRRP